MWIYGRGWDSVCWYVCVCLAHCCWSTSLRWYSVGWLGLSELSLRLFYLVQPWMLCRYGCMWAFAVNMLLCSDVVCIDFELCCFRSVHVWGVYVEGYEWWKDDSKQNPSFEFVLCRCSVSEGRCIVCNDGIRYVGIYVFLMSWWYL